MCSQTCNFIKKETLAQVFSCQFCEISKNIFFTEDLRVTSSVYTSMTNNIQSSAKRRLHTKCLESYQN